MSAIQVLLPVALIVCAETDLIPAPRKIRPLWGEKLVAAWEARRRAERLRNAYKRAYRMPLNRTPEEQRAFEEVAAAYQAVIDTYPGTDIDASCRFRLAGLHGYHSDHVTVIRHLQEIVRLFPGTKHEKQAFLTQGVIYRRSLDDPLGAMRLLEKVPDPGGVDDEGVVPPEKFTDAHAKYLAAQRELARCEAALGRLRSAAKRLEELKRRYPRQAAALDRTMSAIERSESLGSRGHESARETGNANDHTVGGDTDIRSDGRARGLALAEKVEELLEQIRLSSRGRGTNDRIKALIDELRAQRIDVVGLLAEEYDAMEGAVQETTILIKALQYIGSDAAKKVLRDKVLKGGPSAITLGRRAAAAFMALTDNTSEIAELLAAPTPDVRDSVTQELAHRELTPQAVEALGRLLTSKSWVSHNLVGTAFGTDKSPVTAARKVDLLLDAAGHTGELEKAHVLVWGQGTASERVYGSYVSALSIMPAGERPLLARLRAARGIQREMIIIALATRKRQGVHDDLVRIIKTTKNGHVRTMGVRSLGRIATDEDVAMLRRLASSDTFSRPTTHHGHHRPGVAVCFPVREAAAAILKTRAQP